MSSIKTEARKAGALYLLLGITAPFNQIYVPSAFIVSGDAAATARNITAGELTYRLGVFTGLISNIAFLFVALSLYNLLKDVDRKQARLMVVLAAVGATVGIVTLLTQIAPLAFLSGADFLSAFSRPQLEALSLAFLRLRGSGNHLAMAFWALWLYPFGLLVLKSRLFPRVLGILLILGCFAYLVLSFTGIVFPQQRQVVSQVALPFYAVGEVAMILWLLIKGAKVSEPEPGAPGMLPAR